MTDIEIETGPQTVRAAWAAAPRVDFDLMIVRLPAVAGVAWSVPGTDHGDTNRWLTATVEHDVPDPDGPDGSTVTATTVSMAVREADGLDGWSVTARGSRVATPTEIELMGRIAFASYAAYTEGTADHAAVMAMSAIRLG